MSFLWVIFSYVLGSIPFGYIIGRLSGKNVLEIGWRKTSGSNVFKNVGKWQGALTGILDVLKGYLAVWGAEKLGLSSEIQVFSGVAAVTGHNWSCFLRLAGGRGIGTFIGALFSLSPKILGFSLIPLISVALIWNASIGTLLFLTTAILLSIFWTQFETAGVFTLVSLIPILVKRLSPIKEIPPAKNPLVLLRNRLLFDNDQALFDLRIERLLKKKVGRTSFVVKTLADSLLVPPKIGWKAAKIGAKAAVKGVKAAAKPIHPIRKILSNGVKNLLVPEKVVTEIRTGDFKKMMLAASKKIVLHQEEINRINVWPVADKDTGYNLSATLLGIEGAISQKDYSSFLELSRDIREASLINARGNAGMIFTGYLIRFLDQIKNLERVNSLELGLAMRKGTKAAYHAIINPTEGTILDVMKVAGEKSYELAKIKKERHIVKILDEAQKESKIALEKTKEKLEVLRQNNVVDAGALGFVKILEAWLESLKGSNLAIETIEVKISEPEIRAEKKLEYRYDLAFRIKKIKKGQLEKLKNELSQIGDSIDVVEGENELKLHIHVNSPGKVKELVKGFEVLEWRTEDMARQIKKITKKLPLGLVVTGLSNLPKEFLERNKVTEVPFFVRPLNSPGTSAPNFKDFLFAFQKALERFEEILVIVLSSKISAAYSSARIARSMLEQKQRAVVFDCFTAGVGEGLVALKAQELISQGKNKEEILDILKSFCPKIKVIGGFKNFSYLVGSNRTGLPPHQKFWCGGLPKIGVKMISFFSKIGPWFLFGIQEGKVRIFGVRFGKDLAKILLKEIEKMQKGEVLRAAIVYGGNSTEALELKNELEKSYSERIRPGRYRKEKIEILFFSRASAALIARTGPELLIVGLCPA